MSNNSSVQMEDPGPTASGAHDAAHSYLDLGWSVVPVPFRSKFPTIKAWQGLEITKADIPKYFDGRPQNIGVLLGEKSAGLVDIDLDSTEAVRLAPYFLPDTGAIFGRRSKPKSHWLYKCPEIRYRKFNNSLLRSSNRDSDREKACIVEIRTGGEDKGLQTVFPPSIHTSGEAIEWASFEGPATVSETELERAVGLLAAAALLSKFWRRNVRHELALAVSGALQRNGFTVKETRNFIRAICFTTGDEELRDRLNAVDATDKSLKSGKRIFGLPKLAELTGEKVVKSISDWLNLETGAQVGISLVPDEASFRVVCMKDVEAKEIEWVWEPFLPVGEFTILEGIEGLGKSWFACALATAVAAGGTLPFNNSEPVGPANVLLLSAEDSLSHTVKPRLVSMGANLERIFAINGVFSFDNAADLIRFEGCVAKYRPALVVIDPMFSYTGGKNLNTESDSRPIARQLIAIAQKHNCAILGIRHIGKSKGNGDPRNAGLGSISWRASARSVLLIGEDVDSGEKAFCQTKNNLAEQAKISVGFEIIDGRFLFNSKPSLLTKERMLAQPRDAETKADQIQAVEFLQEALRDGERPSKELEKEAKELGITNYFFRKAKSIVGVRSIKRGGNFGGDKVWYLRAEGFETTTEEAAKQQSRHLQSNGSNKASYGNGLAEGVGIMLREPVQQPLPPELIENRRLTMTCTCGELGYSGQSCRDCGD